MQAPAKFAVALTTVLLFACSSPEPEESTPSPTTAVTTPAGIVISSPSPVPASLDDRNCDDFITQDEAQAFYEEAGGPEQDLHGLDPDRNGRACDEGTNPVAPASPATAAPGATPAAQPQAARTPAPPQEYNSVSGDVDGSNSGSSRDESCETDGNERC